MNNLDCYILVGARVVDPGNNIDEVMDVGVQSGKIVSPFDIPDAQRIDLSGKILTPGLIDMHVHLRKPGGGDKEDFKSGTMAAAAGGFTTIVIMPNTSPVADNTSIIDYIKRQTASYAVVNVLPAGAFTKGIAGKEMSGIASLKKAGVVALTDDGKCVQNHKLMRNIFTYAKNLNLPILDHCEDEFLAEDGVAHEGYFSTINGLRGIPSAAEDIIVARDVILAKATDWKVHIQHISSRGSVELVKDARSNGIAVTAEVTPHHIALSDKDIKGFDTNFKMNPPLRSEDDRLRILEGLKDGTISVIATDHAPHSETDKLKEFDYAPFGIVGLETAVAVCMTELYHKEVLSISELISKFTVGPAEVLGTNAGNIDEGMQADLTIIDPDVEHILDKGKFYSKSSNTPFDGYQAKGKAIATIVNGRFVYSELEDAKGMF